MPGNNKTDSNTAFLNGLRLIDLPVRMRDHIRFRRRHEGRITHEQHSIQATAQPRLGRNRRLRSSARRSPNAGSCPADQLRPEIKPGGVLPWHQHANRPALIYMIQGEIVEYASTCAVPIVHRAGDVATETHATSHWWKNLGKETVVLLSADLFPIASPDHHMM
jgi:redox-sensitive bicupin YhaK (pirin superfamily)